MGAKITFLALAVCSHVCAVCRAQFCPQESFSVPQTHPPFAVTTCDIDGDGYVDLLTANADTDDLSVMLNNGDGTFADEQLVPAGDEPVDLVCCDLDGDTDPDLVVAYHVRNSYVSVFENQSVVGSVTLLPRVDYATGLAPWGVRCLDLDDDSLPEVVTSNFTSESVSVLPNLGDGTLGDAIDVPAGGSGTFYIATCDLDGDADLDVVVTNYTGQSISSFRNDRNGSLVRIGVFPVGTLLFPMGLDCCDMNGDGHPDAVTAVSGDDQVAVLFNDGAGRFDDPSMPPAISTTGDAPFKLVCCNIDADDDLDVLTGNLGSDDLTVLENGGKGSLTVERSFPLGSNVGGAACAKFTAFEPPAPVARGDIAAAHLDGVEVFLNACAASGDADGDGDVDLRDVAAFLGCFGLTPTANCLVFDVDGDAIDLPDWAALTPLLTGPGTP